VVERSEEVDFFFRKVPSLNWPSQLFFFFFFFFGFNCTRARQRRHTHKK
jgi:hypothetical protein